MEGRVVLHSDLNNCYASIECMLHPELRGKYIAVCGSTEDRHGIVLAKNQLAKQCGVKTGEVIWEARQKCPQLTIVPPHMDQYTSCPEVADEHSKEWIAGTVKEIITEMISSGELQISAQTPALETNGSSLAADDLAELGGVTVLYGNMNWRTKANESLLHILPHWRHRK